MRISTHTQNRHKYVQMYMYMCMFMLGLKLNMRLLFGQNAAPQKTNLKKCIEKENK